LGGIKETDIPNGFKFTSLIHNTILGGGKSSVLNAEYLVKHGFM
jgi:aspartate-semialdehyde dehydrogenase